MEDNTSLYALLAIALFIGYILFGNSRKIDPVKKFAEWLNDKNVVFLDTETTGLGKKDEVIELAIISNTGEVLFDERFMPKCSIGIEATDVHGMTKRNLKGSPTWNQLHTKVMSVLKSKKIIAYNSEYDIRMLEQTIHAHDCKLANFNHECAMKMYAVYRGDINEHYGDYRWHKLTKAAKDEGVVVENAHSALGDCRMTIGVLQAVINKERENG